MVHVMTFGRMGSNDNVDIRKRLIKFRDQLLKIPEHGTFVIPQPFGIFPAHTPGGAAESGGFTGLFHRVK